MCIKERGQEIMSISGHHRSNPGHRLETKGGAPSAFGEHDMAPINPACKLGVQAQQRQQLPDTSHIVRPTET